MRKILMVFVLGGFVQFAQAQDPHAMGKSICEPLVSTKSRLLGFQFGSGCVYSDRTPFGGESTFHVAIADLSMLLLAKQLTAQEVLLQQVQSLRKELAANTAKLEETKKAYDAANAKASAWRDDSLKTLVEEVKAAPSELAANPILQEALLPVVAAKLLADPAFVDAVRGTGDSLRNGQQQ